MEGGIASAPVSTQGDPKISLEYQNMKNLSDKLFETFLSNCREIIWSTEESVDLKVLRYERNWKQLAFLTSSIPIEEYISNLLSDTSKKELFLTRIECLFKLKLYDDIFTFVSTLLEGLQIQLLSMTQMTVSKVQIIEDICLMLRLMICEIKVLTGRGEESIQQLYQLEQYILTPIIPITPTTTTNNNTTTATNTATDTNIVHSNDNSNTTNTTNTTINTIKKVNIAYPTATDHTKWHHIIRAMKINVFIRQYQWSSALKELCMILQELNNETIYTQELNHITNNNNNNNTTTINSKIATANVININLYSKIATACLLCRVYIQIGGLSAAATFYNYALLWYESIPSKMILDFTGDHDYDYIWDIIHVTEGILLFAQSQYEMSMSVFKSIIDRQRDKNAQKTSDVLSANQPYTFHMANLYIYGISNRYTTPPLYLFASADFTQTMIIVAVNNISVCALYLKNIELAISNLEHIIQENPYEYMTSHVVFNLCTLYDLSTSPQLSLIKKTIIHKIAAIYNVNETIVPFQSYRLN